MNKLLILAALSVPTAAHAEFRAAPAASEPLTVDAMLAKIQSSYMSRMRRCYNKGLARNPALTGKVTVTFTVNRYGRVDGEATGIAPKVDACLTSAISTWRFPTTSSRKEATFRISLSLTR